MNKQNLELAKNVLLASWRAFEDYFSNVYSPKILIETAFQFAESKKTTEPSNFVFNATKD